MTPEHIPFIDLRPGEDDVAVREAIDRVLKRGWFVLGPEVDAFETEFARASGERKEKDNAEAQRALRFAEKRKTKIKIHHRGHREARRKGGG